MQWCARARTANPKTHAASKVHHFRHRTPVPGPRRWSRGRWSASVAHEAPRNVSPTARSEFLRSQKNSKGRENCPGSVPPASLPTAAAKLTSLSRCCCRIFPCCFCGRWARRGKQAQDQHGKHATRQGHTYSGAHSCDRPVREPPPFTGPNNWKVLSGNAVSSYERWQRFTTKINADFVFQAWI